MRFKREGQDPFLTTYDKNYIPPLVSVGKLLAAASRVMQDPDTEEYVRHLLAPGFSLGGARPKSFVRDKDGHLAIAKFPRKDDEMNTIVWEAVALLLANNAGITVPEWRIETVGRQQILLSRRFDRKKNIRIPFLSAMSILGAKDNEIHSYLEIADAIRQMSASPIFPKYGFKKIMIVSGDREEEVRYLANHLGITDVYASKSPEEKVDIVVRETQKAKTAYLGDGINDASALLASTVGIAFGRNSDITTEPAGVVVMESSLEIVDEFLHISKRMRTIALQSALGGMILSIIGMIIAAFGFLSPVAGAISQEVIDVIAVMNSLRTIWKPSKMSDMPLVKIKK